MAFVLYDSNTMQIVDAHLDLAYNALNGRDVTSPAAQQPANEDGIATVGLPDLRRGNVSLVCATIFCEPASPSRGGYSTPDEARAVALKQLQWYREQIAAGTLRFVTGAATLPADEDSPPAQGPQRALLLLEGADPIRSPDDLAEWFDAGLRIVGLAWRRTRFAGGTGAPGPLTADGVALVRALDLAGILHDVSHLAEESFWELMGASTGPVLASHSNCRTIVPTDRQLSDAMIRAIAARGGVIGINYFDKFLLSPGEFGKRRATLADVARHVRHICDVVGDAGHVGIGTDMDGGFGQANIPQEIQTSADLPRTGEALASAGFNAKEVRGILGGNWLRFFRENLPHSQANS